MPNRLENLRSTSCFLRLADQARDKGKMTLVGTFGYTAPEIIRGENYGPSVDVYSFAIVAYELVTLTERYATIRGGHDRNSANVPWQAIQNRVATQGLRPQIPDGVSSK